MKRRELLERCLNAEESNYFSQPGVTVDPSVTIQGELPIIYNPYGATLHINAHTVLNSDNTSSFVPISSPVKFALGEGATIHIGEHCDLNGCCITAYQGVVIGNYVQIGPSTWITDTDLHALDPAVRRQQLLSLSYDHSRVMRGKVVIEDDVWIGAGVIILKGVTIGRGAVIGAGSTVVHNVPPFTVVAGCPAKPVGSTSHEH